MKTQPFSRPAEPTSPDPSNSVRPVVISLRPGVGWIASASLALCCQLLPWSQAHAAFTVQDGYDLFYTQPGTTFGGVNWTGVPLGNTLLGNLGTVDTVIHRTAAAVGSAGGSATVPIQVEALSLSTTAPVNLGAGVGFYYAMVMAPTILAVPPVGAGAGSMTINFGLIDQADPAGTFTSDFGILAQLYFSPGLLTDAATVLNNATPVGFLPHLGLNNGLVPWRHDPPTGTPLINGVTALLNGVDFTEDFWPLAGPPVSVGAYAHVVSADPNGTYSFTELPEPSTYGIGLAMVGTCFGVWRRAGSQKPPTSS